jgi:cyclohexanone monooxygenase
VTPATDSFADLTTEQIRERFEQAWEAGELYSILAICSDLMQNREANDVVVGLIHEKIRAIVADPDTANSLCPSDYPFGTRRPCLGTDYYETYNRPNVRLIDLRKHPLEAITEHGIAVVGEQLDIDTLVLATGFDAMTGALLAIEVTGRDGLSLAEAWHGGPSTYLGLMTAGFPNLFMVTGPGSPSVLSNMAMSIQHDVEWIAETLQRLAAHGWVTLEATRPAQEAWVRHVNAVATPTLYPTANSWYTGANVPGKPRVFMPYLGGHGNYREICAEVRDRDFLGFTRTSPSGTVTNGGIIRDAPAAEPGSIFAIAFEE